MFKLSSMCSFAYIAKGHEFSRASWCVLTSIGVPAASWGNLHAGLRSVQLSPHPHLTWTIGLVVPAEHWELEQRQRQLGKLQRG